MEKKQHFLETAQRKLKDTFNENFERVFIIFAGILIAVFFTSVNAFATSYYVNDNVTGGGDIYTTQPGLTANNGTTPSTPKRLISEVISSYTLLPGDIVYVDAGVFTEVVTFNTSGTAGNYIRFVGVDKTLTFIQAATVAASNPGAGGVFYNNGFNYISIEQMNISIYDNTGTTADDNNNTATAGIKFTNNAANNIVSACQISNVGYGIDITGNAGATEVKGSFVYSFYVGIRMKFIAAGGCNIHNNWVELTPKSTSGSAFGTIEIQDGTNCNVHHNKLIARAHPTGVAYAEGTVHAAHNSTNLTFSNNYIWMGAAAQDIANENPAIVVDDETDISFINNSIYSVSQCFVYMCAQCDVALQYGTPQYVNHALNAKLINNIFYSTNGDCIDLRCLSSDGTQAGIYLQPKFNMCDENLYYAPLGAIERHTPFINNNPFSVANYTGPTLARTSLSSWQTYDPDAASGANTGEVNGIAGSDPQYIAPAAINLNIPAGSPAQDKVINHDVASITDDIVGTMRPSGSYKEIGAFEIVIATPVEMIDIQGKCEGENNVVQWKTTKEINNSHYEIKYSGDGKKFITLASVYAPVTDGVINEYAYSDPNHSGGYYRIVQYDLDGQATVYPIIYIENCGNSSSSLAKAWYSDNLLCIEQNNNVAVGQKVTVTLYNMLGVILWQQQTVCENTNCSFKLSFDLTSLASAAYIAAIQVEDQDPFTIKIVKP